MPKLYALSGGAGSGKSAFSVALALKLGQHRYFIASAQQGDKEMADKIAAHKEERGKDFITLEQPFDIESALAEIPTDQPNKVILWDCLTLWLSNGLYGSSAASKASTPEQILARLEGILTRLKSLDCPVIVVTNELGMGLVPMEAESRRFRNLAGKAGQLLSAAADEAYLIVMGRALPLAVCSAEHIVDGTLSLSSQPSSIEPSCDLSFDPKP